MFNKFFHLFIFIRKPSYKNCLFIYYYYCKRSKIQRGPKIFAVGGEEKRGDGFKSLHEAKQKDVSFHHRRLLGCCLCSTFSGTRLFHLDPPPSSPIQGSNFHNFCTSAGEFIRNLFLNSMRFSQFLRFYLDCQVPETFMFGYQMKAIVLLGIRFV